MRHLSAREFAPALCIWLVFALAAETAQGAPASNSRGVSGALFAGDFGRWLENEAIPELTTLVAKHPRFRGEQIRVVAMERGRPALAANQLSAAVRDLFIQRLSRIKDVQVVWQSAPAPCGVPRKTTYLLGVEISSESPVSSVATVAMIDVDEAVWVSGAYMQWRGELVQQERRALSRITATAPAGTIDSPLPDDRRKQITAVLLESIECSLQGGLEGGVRIVAADQNDELLSGVAAELREALTRSATISVVGLPAKAGGKAPQRAEWVLELRASSDIGEAVVATLVPWTSDIAARGGDKSARSDRQRLAAVFIRRAGKTDIASSRELTAGPGQPTTQTGNRQPVGRRHSDLVQTDFHMSVIEQFREVPARPGDQCYQHSASCVEFQFSLAKSSFLFMLRTQADGNLILASCRRPKKTAGTKRFRMRTSQTDAMFYAVATTDAGLARRLHLQLAAGASNCDDSSRSDWLDQLEATLAGTADRLDWQAVHLPGRAGSDSRQFEVLAANQPSRRSATAFPGGKEQ